MSEFKTITEQQENALKNAIAKFQHQHSFRELDNKLSRREIADLLEVANNHVTVTNPTEKADKEHLLNVINDVLGDVEVIEVDLDLDDDTAGGDPTGNPDTGDQDPEEEEEADPQGETGSGDEPAEQDPLALEDAPADDTTPHIVTAEDVENNGGENSGLTEGEEIGIPNEAFNEESPATGNQDPQGTEEAPADADQPEEEKAETVNVNESESADQPQDGDEPAEQDPLALEDAPAKSEQPEETETVDEVSADEPQDDEDVLEELDKAATSQDEEE